MIKIKPYISPFYDTPEEAQTAANILGGVDNNNYSVYCEVTNGNSRFFFDNTADISFLQGTTLKKPTPIDAPRSIDTSRFEKVTTITPERKSSVVPVVFILVVLGWMAILELIA